jgi:prevent-host-death family protein
MSWSVAEAKAHLSEIMRRARMGEPQVIGVNDPCVIISQSEYESRGARQDHLGRALLNIGAQAGVDIKLPRRQRGRKVQMPRD